MSLRTCEWRCKSRKPPSSGGKFEWITRKGTKSNMPLPKGWLTVSEALTLPEPDTSWMSNPLKRRDFIGWLPAS